MGSERLELSHIAALDPKSSASTNFATSPRFFNGYWFRIKNLTQPSINVKQFVFFRKFFITI